jgi:type I restriction enzyme S subunit
VFKLKNENKIKSEYLFYVFKSEKFKKQADSFFKGSARPSINFTDFCKIQVPVPSLEEQKKSIEELNNIKKMIRNSEELLKEKKEKEQKLLSNL